jgi:hypothetical protein
MDKIVFYSLFSGKHYRTEGAQLWENIAETIHCYKRLSSLSFSSENCGYQGDGKACRQYRIIFPATRTVFYISPCRKNLPVPGGRSFLSAMPVWVAQFIVWPCNSVVKKITNTAAREVFSSNWHHLGPYATLLC